MTSDDYHYQYVHVPGHSAYDHYASEIIRRAMSEQRETKAAMADALHRAWLVVRPRCAIGPRIDVRVVADKRADEKS